MSLRAQDVCFSYGERLILDHVNLTVERGEIIGLHGYSGAGKTTLAKILSGHQDPDRGSVTVGGAAMKPGRYRPVQLIQQHPERAIDARWRLDQVVAGIPPETLDRMGVERDWLNRYPLEVSGGQLQRLNISRALDPRTEYIVADEITTMLDALLQADIWAGLVEEVRRRSMGMLVISHDHHLLRHVCDRVAALDSL